MKALRDKFANIGSSSNEATEWSNITYWRELELDMRMGLLMQDRFTAVKKSMIEEGLLPNSVKAEKITKMYFITVRPNESKTTFKRFFELVGQFVGRECFEHFTLAFEQKGLTPETLGSGYHVHILAKMHQASKGQVLRDTISTFKRCTSENCIQVDKVKTKIDADRIMGYIRDHLAQDGHKILTEAQDALWRQREGIEALYIEVPHLSSPVMGQSELTEPLVMSWN